MRKRDRDVSKLEPKTLKGKFMGYTERERGYLMYIPNTRTVVAVRDVIIKEFEVGSISDNTETPDLLDEGSRNWGCRTQMMVTNKMGKNKKLGTCTAKEKSSMTQRPRTLNRRH